MGATAATAAVVREAAVASMAAAALDTLSVETAVGAEAGGELTAEWMAVGARVAPLVEPRAAAKAVLLMAVAFSVRAQP